MKAATALLKADIQDELSKLEKVYNEFKSFAPKLDLKDDEMGNYDKIVVGYLLHSFYNGCENIFRSVAAFFENDLGTGSWHKDLLRRMRLEITGYRPRVISDELYACLDDFRGFRHRFRHSYGFELDWEREKVVARKMDKAFQLMQEELTVFMSRLDSLDGLEADDL
ncbi:conserved hypothetical protein [Desulfonatronospira thiodismutans ASO3-1]|uniref:HepT-like domain-containing protein n=1 Tax=Desulfonatronospira thiodismutans ASO3-1 TaxID=555779 RepID=D6STY8_9BACT|nr:hypothetical protein [Desulfonatronospira thiodismutans]EFI34154.1 conserved hypothetical protein [Desulfonatronospira thiodismutans ASO3-1]